MTNNWIKCSEQLPDLTENTDRTILIYDLDGDTSITWVTNIKHFSKYGGVTHWMELPSKPELEE